MLTDCRGIEITHGRKIFFRNHEGEILSGVVVGIQLCDHTIDFSKVTIDVDDRTQLHTTYVTNVKYIYCKCMTDKGYIHE